MRTCYTNVVNTSTYMVCRSSSSWASLLCLTIFRVLMSSVTVLSSPANSCAKLLCSSSSGWNSTELTFLLGVTAAMRVKALVLLNRVPHCGSGVSEGTEEKVNYRLDYPLAGRRRRCLCIVNSFKLHCRFHTGRWTISFPVDPCRLQICEWLGLKCLGAAMCLWFVGKMWEVMREIICERGVYTTCVCLLTIHSNHQRFKSHRCHRGVSGNHCPWSICTGLALLHCII